MNLARLLSGERSISTRLLFWFLALSLIPTGLLTLVVSYVSARSLERTMRRGLSVIAESKVRQIESFLRERRGDATVAGRLPFVVNATKSLPGIIDKSGFESAEYAQASEQARNTLNVYRETLGYTNAFLFDDKGRLLFQLERQLEIGDNLLDGPLRDSELGDAFRRSLSQLQAVLADYQPYPGQRDPLAFVGNPVIEPGGRVIGVILLQLGNQTVYEIVGDVTGLGSTGETLAGQIRGDEITFVVPTRYRPDAAFRLQTRADDPRSSALQYAVRGRKGFGDTTDYRGESVAAVWTYIPSARWGLVVKMDSSEAYELIDLVRMAVLGLLVATLATVIPIARAIARGLSRPIQAAVDVANQVAGGDLTAEVQLKARGEAGRLLTAITTMTRDLRSLIGRVQKSSVALMSTATEIAATSRQQEQTVHDHGASTNEAAAAVKEISATGQELLRTMNELNHVAAETATMATHGQESLGTMDATMRQLAESTASIGSKLSVISERAANINLAVITITKVADQTNLLSINAAIEAEKAGEYGLGFLVVAREIRRLADMTAVSTLDIERMVKEMQYSVSAGVMEMDKFSDQVRQGVHEVAQINEKLTQIISAVQGLTGRFDQVTDGMRVQAQGADQIREAVVRISEGASQTLASLREFNQATAHLREAVGGLKEEVSRFRVESGSPAAP